MKNPSTNAGDASLIPEWGPSPGEGNGFPLQYSCLENSMDRGTWAGRGAAGYSSWDHKELGMTEHTAPGCGGGVVTPDRKVLLVAQLFLTLCDPMYYSPPKLFCPWNFPGKITRLGCHSRLQEIELGSSVSHILYLLSHQRSPDGKEENNKNHQQQPKCFLIKAPDGKSSSD